MDLFSRDDSLYEVIRAKFIVLSLVFFPIHFIAFIFDSQKWTYIQYTIAIWMLIMLYIIF